MEDDPLLPVPLLALTKFDAGGSGETLAGIKLLGIIRLSISN